MTRTRLLVCISFFVATLLGCTAPAVNTPTPLPVPTRPTVTVEPMPGALVEYKRVGGIVGFNDHLVIQPDGKATLTRRAGKFDFTLGGEQIKQIQAAFQIAGFANLREGPSKLLVPDELSYVIVYQGKAFRTSDTQMPAELQPVMAILNGIVDAKGK
ncbi:MAG: hypothetical protein HY868_12990 [Chloroflexi bacterium]|nr:hypothetical protein [Chloroflexota bacterium]